MSEEASWRRWRSTRKPTLELAKQLSLLCIPTQHITVAAGCALHISVAVDPFWKMHRSYAQVVKRLLTGKHNRHSNMLHKISLRVAENVARLGGFTAECFLSVFASSLLSPSFGLILTLLWNSIPRHLAPYLRCSPDLSWHLYLTQTLLMLTSSTA